MTHDEAARLFADNLSLIQRTIEDTGRRHGLSPKQADEFRAWAMRQFVDDEYRLLSDFRGQYSIAVYLMIVAVGLVRDFRLVTSVDTQRISQPVIDSSLEGHGAEQGSAELVARVTCDGTVVGTARFEHAAGLAHARFFRPDDAYHMIAPPDRRDHNSNTRPPA